MKILNMTIHTLTPSQISDGGFEPSEEVKNEIKEYLLITEIPTRIELEKIGAKFARLCYKVLQKNKGSEKISFLIGSGTPSAQPYITKHLERLGVDYVYSHSSRECVEVNNPDGTVTKTYVFSHQGWY